MIYSHLNLDITHIPVAAKTNNLGDDIQSYCAAKFWNVRAYVNRDGFRSWSSDMKIPLVGWYGWDMENFPPQCSCYLVSVHFCEKAKRIISSRQKCIGWLRECVQSQGFPALCRDTETSQYLNSIGVDAEFHGCITSTLEKYSGSRSGIFSIDTPFVNEAEQFLSHCMPNLASMSLGERVKVAERQIRFFAQAKKIHTSRLHVALPCRALGTEVVFHPHNLFEPMRFSGHKLF